MIVETSFLIPLKDNFTGDLHPVEKFRQLEEELAVMFGGWTDAESVRGCWLDTETQRLVYEQSQKYTLAVDEKDLDMLRAYLRNEIRIIFGQKVIYFEVDGKVEFLA